MFLSNWEAWIMPPCGTHNNLWKPSGGLDFQDIFSFHQVYRPLSSILPIGKDEKKNRNFQFSPRNFFSHLQNRKTLILKYFKFTMESQLNSFFRHVQVLKPRLAWIHIHELEKRKERKFHWFSFPQNSAKNAKLVSSPPATNFRKLFRSFHNSDIEARKNFFLKRTHFYLDCLIKCQKMFLPLREIVEKRSELNFPSPPNTFSNFLPLFSVKKRLDWARTKLETRTD